MTKRIMYVFLALCLICCKQVKKEYYENGSIKREYQMYNYVPEGYDKSYYPNGQLKEVFYRIDFKKNGELKSYFENGMLESKGIFKNDSLISSFSYDKNGVLISENSFADLFKVYSYYKNGALYKEEYLRKVMEKGTQKLQYIAQDSCIIYAYNADKSKHTRRLFIQNYFEKENRSTLSYYSQNGDIEKRDTIDEMGKEKIERIKKEALGRDTLEIGYVPMF